MRINGFTDSKFVSSKRNFVVLIFGRRVFWLKKLKALLKIYVSLFIYRPIHQTCLKLVLVRKVVMN